MAIVQQAQATAPYNYGAGPTVLSVPFVSAVTQGHGIFVLLDSGGVAVEAFTVDDGGRSPAYTQVSDPGGTAIFYSVAGPPASGALTVNTSKASGGSLIVMILEVTDDLTLWKPDQNAVYVGSFLPGGNAAGVGAEPVNIGNTIVMFSARASANENLTAASASLREIADNSTIQGVAVGLSNYAFGFNRGCDVYASGSYQPPIDSGEFWTRISLDSATTIWGTPYLNLFLSDMTVYTLSLPRALPDPTTPRAVGRGGRSAILGVYDGQTELTTTLPYVPDVGDLLIVGIASDRIGEQLNTPTDNQSPPNTYNFLVFNDPGAGLPGFLPVKLYYSVVAVADPAELFQITFTSPKAAAFLGGALSIMVLRLPLSGLPFFEVVKQEDNTVAPGVITPYTFQVNAALGTDAIGVAVTLANVDDPVYPFPVVWSPISGYTLDYGLEYQQTTQAQITQRSRVGIASIFHQHLSVTQLLRGEITVTPGGPSGTGIAALIVSYSGAVCPVIPTLNVGVPYMGGASVGVTGGTPPYTYAVTSGALPPGMTLNPNTGVISGTPIAPGSYSYTVTVTDSVGAGSITDVCPILVIGVAPPDLCELVEVPGYNPTQVFVPMPPELQGS